MPFFNSRGDICAGVGDGVVSVTFVGDAPQVYWSPGGGTHWLDDDTIIYQANHDGTERIEARHLPTNKVTVLSLLGANVIEAGGGRFLAWLAGTGMYGSVSSAVAFPTASSIDGTFAIIPDQQTGIGFSLFAADGRVTVGPDEETEGLCITSPTSAIWTPVGGGEFRTLNMRVPKQAAKARRPRVATVNGVDWIVYYTDAYGVIAHPFDDLNGVVVSTQDAFYHEAMGVGGRLFVTYSLRQGELPEDIVVRALDIRGTQTPFAETYVPPIEATFREFTNFSSSGGNPTANSSYLVRPQMGLLEDDIVYRLALLATNVLQPLKNKFPNITIKSGLRQPNTGKGQHELGEAVDLQINNQTTEQLLTVANYIKNNLPFDQLIMSYSNIGDNLPWIHVSFSPNALRGQVLTKDYADVFHDGLFLISSLTGEQAAAQLRTQTTSDSQILSEMTKIQNRQNKLTPIATVQDEVPAPTTSTVATTGSSGGSTGSGSGGGSTPGGLDHGDVNAHRAVVACVQKALGLKTNSDPDHNAQVAFETCKRVAWLLREEGAGLLIGPAGGENVVSFNGYIVRAARIVYPDGQVFKILSDVDGGTHAPGWEDDGLVDADAYVPPSDPGNDYGTGWTTCSLPNPTR